MGKDSSHGYEESQRCQLSGPVQWHQGERKAKLYVSFRFVICAAVSNPGWARFPVVRSSLRVRDSCISDHGNCSCSDSHLAFIPFIHVSQVMVEFQRPSIEEMIVNVTYMNQKAAALTDFNSLPVVPSYVEVKKRNE